MTRKNLTRRRLLLQRLGEIAVAFLQFLEQPHVLDGDHRLVGEGLEQRDLFFGKRTRPPSRRIVIAPIGCSFAQQRRGEHGADARADPAVAARDGVRVCTPDVVNVDGLADRESLDRSSSRSADRMRGARVATCSERSVE